MKSEIVEKKYTIDFNIPMLLISTLNKTVILSSGNHELDSFEGTVIYDGVHDIYQLGHTSDEWKKCNFTIFNGEIKLSN